MCEDGFENCENKAIKTWQNMVLASQKSFYMFVFWLLGQICLQQLQRNLQLRIEEQGKHLQKMFEEQQKATGDIINASPSSRGTYTRSSEAVILECEPFLHNATIT